MMTTCYARIIGGAVNGKIQRVLNRDEAVAKKVVLNVLSNAAW